jgi:GAF domain-containing protein
MGHRTTLATPLMRDDEAIGALTIRRNEVRPFSDKQIDLLKTFADQAAIAIQNVTLFEEVQAKTRDLEESLTFQKATSDVLEVIGKSASTLQPVLNVIVDTAVDLCAADASVIRLMKNGSMHYAASSSRMDPEVRDYVMDHPIAQNNRSSVAGRVVLEGRTIQIPNVRADAEYTFLPDDSPVGAVLGVPLLHGGKVAGAIILLRKAVGPFTPRQIALVETFADQAVIAIENVRLFTELGDALQQQTATADVLKVISRSAFDLQTVLDTLVESATRVCEAEKGVIFQRREDLYHMTANHGFSHEYEEYARAYPLSVNTGSTTGRVVLSGKTVHIADVLADPDYKVLGHQEHGGYRTSLGVPLLSKGEPVGVFVLTRPEVKPFTAKQIELVETFAD